MDLLGILRGKQFFVSKWSPKRTTYQLLILSIDYQELGSKLGLNADYYGTHSMRRTKATLIYAKTKNIRAVQILLGHSKLDNTIRYLGVELEDALRLSEQIDC